MHIQSIIYKRSWGLIRLFFAALAIAGIAFMGCRKTSQLSRYKPIDDTKSDTLRLFNLLPDSSYPDNEGYLLYVNDSLNMYTGRGLISQYTSYGLPPALGIPAGGGQFTLKIASFNNALTPPVNPDSVNIVCQTTITIPAHSGFGYIFVYDSANKAVIRYIPASSADPGAPAPGTFKVRVVNFGYNLDPGYGVVPNSADQQYNIQLQTQDSAVIAGDGNVPFAAASPYTEYPYGTYQFLLYNNTTNSYYNTCGPLNDMLGTFNMSPLFTYSYYNNGNGYNYNWLFPNFLPDHVNRPTVGTDNPYNIGSYQFSAGGCYSVYAVANMYAVVLDRQYGTGTLDNFGKVQLVNVAPGLTDLSVSMTTADNKTQQVSLPFGSYTEPVIVPAGNVSLTYSSGGKTVFTYSASVPRLGNYTFYYGTDLKQVPYVFPTSNVLTPLDYYPASASSLMIAQMAKVDYLNMSPDAGGLYFTNENPQNGDLELQGGGTPILFEGVGSETDFDGTTPPIQFNVRLEATRSDSLANRLVASLSNPFPVIPAPGTYTLVVAGLLDAPNPASALKMILVKKTNFIPKAQ